MKRQRIGLALGSGSARGWSHIGVIDALLEAGIEPTIVCGTSIGSLVGAAYVSGHLDDLRSWAEDVTWRDIVSLMDVRLSGGGLIDGALIINLLRKLGMTGNIEDYKKRYAAVATELATGRELWLQTGSLVDAVRASIALPGIFSPADRDGTWLVDGGLCNPVPVSVCRALGADVIIAVNLNGDLLGRRFTQKPDETSNGAGISTEMLDRVLSPLPAVVRKQAMQIVPRLMPQADDTPGYFDVLANSINIMQDHITRTRLAGEPPHVLLVPRLADMRLMDYHRAGDAIAEGRATVEQSLPTLKRYIRDL